MAYGEIYRWQGERDDGTDYQVSIYKRDYEGSVTSDFELSAESGGPWSHRVGKRGDDVDTVLSEHTVQLYVIAENAAFLSDIEEAGETDYLLQIHTGTTTPNILNFIGIVETSLGERTDTDGRQVVIVTAKSGLDWLHFVPYPVTSGRASLRAVAKTALDELPYGSLKMQVIDRWFTSEEQSGDPFEQVEVDQFAYRNSSCREVLLDVLGRKGLNCRQSEGRWFIQQPDALYEGTTRWYLYDTAGQQESTFGSYNPSRSYDRQGFMGSYPTIFRRPAVGKVDIVYQHEKFADSTFENANFEVKGDDGMPEGWESGITPGRTRWAQGTLEIDFWYQRTLSRNDYRVGHWSAFQEGKAVSTEQAAGTIVFEARIMPFAGGGGQPFNQWGTAMYPRPLPVYARVGKFFWDTGLSKWQGGDWEIDTAYVAGDVVWWGDGWWRCVESHTSGSTTEPGIGGSYTDVWTLTTPIGNPVLVTFSPEECRLELGDWPEDAPLEIGFYAPKDHRATPISPAPSGGIPEHWGSDCKAVRIDNLRLEIADESGIEASEHATSMVLDSGSSRNERRYTFRIGQGPTRAHISRITDSSGGEVLGWQYEDDFSGGSSGVDLDVFHAGRMMGMLRKPRLAKFYRFRRLTFEMSPHRVLDEDGARYFPVYYESTPYFGLFGGEYVRIRRDGEAGTTTSTVAKRAGVSLGGNRTEVYEQFSTQIVNALTASQTTSTDDVIESGNASSIPITALTEEVGRAGARFVLVDPDTLDRHILTLTGPILTGAGTASIEQYNFPKAIRAGAPIFMHDGDIWNFLILTEQAFGVSMRAGSVAQLDGDHDLDGTEVSPALTVTETIYDIHENDEIEVLHKTTAEPTIALAAADVAQGATSIPVKNGTVLDAPSGSPLRITTRQMRADIKAQADEIQLRVTSEQVSESVRDTVRGVGAWQALTQTGTTLSNDTNILVDPIPTALPAGASIGFLVDFIVSTPGEKPIGMIERVLDEAAEKGATTLVITEPITIGVQPIDVYWRTVEATEVVSQSITQLSGELTVEAGKISANTSLIQQNSDAIAATQTAVGIINNSFEYGDVGWVRQLTQSAIEDVGSEAHTGTNVLRLNNGSGGPNAYPNQFTAVSVGERIKATAWARANPNDPPDANQRIEIRWVDAAGATVGTTTNPTGTVTPSDTDWKQVSVVGNAPAGAASFRIRLGEGDGTGSYWWDDVLLYRIPDGGDIEALASLDIRVTETEASITQSVQYNEVGGEVRLVAGPGGSEFTVAADQIKIDGTTTFGSGFDPREKPEVQYGGSQPTTRADGSALKTGDMWIASDSNRTPWLWDGDSWERIYNSFPFSRISGEGNLAHYDAVLDAMEDETIIIGGFLDTTLINVDDLFAQNASIAGTLTMGTGGEIKNAGGEFSITENGIALVRGEGIAKAVRWVESGSDVLSISAGNQFAQITTGLDLQVWSDGAIAILSQEFPTARVFVGNWGGIGFDGVLAGSRFAVDSSSSPGSTPAFYVDGANGNVEINGDAVATEDWVSANFATDSHNHDSRYIRDGGSRITGGSISPTHRIPIVHDGITYFVAAELV